MHLHSVGLASDLEKLALASGASSREDYRLIRRSFSRNFTLHFADLKTGEVSQLLLVSLHLGCVLVAIKGHSVLHPLGVAEVL